MIVEHALEIKARCPVDGRTDWYEAVFRAGRVVPVEEILAAVAAMASRAIFQEDLTGELSRALGVEVETVGFHSGVRTRVVCGRAAKSGPRREDCRRPCGHRGTRVEPAEALS